MDQFSNEESSKDLLTLVAKGKLDLYLHLLHLSFISFRCGGGHSKYQIHL